MDSVVSGLNRASRFIRGRLGKEVDLRNTPTIRFLADGSFAEGQRMDRLLASLKPTADDGAEDNEQEE